jgi:hypothetical protein
VPAGWIAEAIRAAPLERVAADLGVEVRRKHLAACPSCGAAGHGSGKLYRGTEGVRWHCHRCDADGDAVGLVAHHLHGSSLSPDQWRAVREWFTIQGYLDTPGKLRANSRPQRTREPQTTQRVEPKYPPTEALQAVWAQGVPMGKSPEGLEWCRRYAIVPHRVDALHMARILPKGAALPSWARCAGHSWAKGWRLLLPVYGPAGRVVSIQARWLHAGEAPKKAKEGAPAGFSRSGCVYADPMGVALLQGRQVDAGVNWDGRVVFTEGGKDFLTWATREGRVSRGRAYAVFGVWQGAWTAELATRIPDGGRVIIRTDQNEAGDRYAAAIADTLSRRCEVLRPTQEHYSER